MCLAGCWLLIKSCKQAICWHCTWQVCQLVGRQQTLLFLHCHATTPVYDDQGELLGELGSSTPSVVMALPLPLYACWAQLLLTASHLQHWDIAKRAAAVLLPRFVATTPSRLLWQAHPKDRHQLQLQQLQAASPTLLRLLVQAVYVYAQHTGEQQQLAQVPTAAGAAGEGAVAAGGLAGTAASRALLLQLSESQVPQQVAVLKSGKKLMAAMQVGSARYTVQLLY
jgi:hypothetical protein